MSQETTLFTVSGYMDVSDTSHGGVTANGHNKSGGSGNSETGEVLCYPGNVFDWTTGSPPKDEEAAHCLWSYRKARPNKDNGSANMVPADGETMLNEMRSKRTSTKFHNG